MTHSLKEACRQLRLSGWPAAWTCACRKPLPSIATLQFLELLLQDEMNVRAQRQLERRKKAASFRDLKPWKTLTGVSILH